MPTVLCNRNEEQMLDRKPVILVVGAGFGVGREVAKRFAVGGFHVLLCGRTQAKLEHTRDQIHASDGTCGVYPVDICDAAAVSNLFERVARDVGRVDILWNGAATFLEGRLEDLPLDHAMGVLDVGAIAAIRLTTLFLRQAPKNPLVFNVTCDWDFPTTGGISTFIAAKKALEGFCVALQKERSGDVRMCIVAPADVATYSHPDGASVEQIVRDTNGSAIAPSELADLCYMTSRYESLFVHKIVVRPFSQKFSITYN